MSGRLYAMAAELLAKQAQTHAENAGTVVGIPAAAKAEWRQAADAARGASEFATYAAGEFDKEVKAIP